MTYDTESLAKFANHGSTLSDWERKRLLDQVKWDTSLIAYVEAHHGISASDGVSRPSPVFVSGRLQSDEDLIAWLNKPRPAGSFAKSPFPSPGGFSLLITAMNTFSHKLWMSSKSFLEVKEAFNLSTTQLLYSLANNLPGSMYNLSFRGNFLQLSVSLLGLTSSTGAVELHYDYEKKHTFALLAIVLNKTEDAGIATTFTSVIDVINGILRSQSGLWSHWACIPLALQELVMEGVRRNLQTNDSAIRSIEGTIGVSKHGPIVTRGAFDGKWPVHIDFKNVLLDLYQVRRSVSFKKNMVLPSYQQSRTLMLKLSRDFRPRWKLEDVVLHQFANQGRLLDNRQTALQAHMSNSLVNLQSLSDLVYNAITQKDSIIAQDQTNLAHGAQDLNIKIAASTKDDSISMLTFTFIAAMFLPGTFLSSFLSMTLVDWFAATEGDGEVQVSHYYWVFWVLDIPLTIAVLAGWFLYRRYASKKLDQELK